MPAPDDPSRPGDPSPLPTLAPAARENAVTVLTRSYAADQLTEADFEARLDRVYQATTLAQLDAVLADLPAGPAVAVPGTDVHEVSALLSGQEARITGPVPRHLRLRARLGYVELDLTRAGFGPGTTEIDVHAFLGYVEIRLPAGVRVESTGDAVLGFFALKGGRVGAHAPDAPVVRLTGRASLGYAECSIAYRRDVLPAAGKPRPEPGRGDAAETEP